jgi:hypothetical protein
MSKALATKGELRTVPQYREYEEVLEWFRTNGEGDLPPEFKRRLKLWKFADAQVCKGYLSLETVAKMMIAEFPEEKLTLKTAWRHVTNAVNYYNSSKNLSKSTHIRMIMRQIDDFIAVMWKVLPNKPTDAGKLFLEALKQKTALVAQMRDEDPDAPGAGETWLIFDSDHLKHGYPDITERQLDTLFEEFIEAEIIDEDEANQLRQEVGLKPKDIKQIPE